MPSLTTASLGLLVPIVFPSLILNVLTQLLCINGVNRLTSICSSLTVTLVLVVRKAISLAISVLILAPARGEEMHGKWLLGAGATSVLLGTVGYAIGSSAPPPKSKERATASQGDASGDAHSTAVRQRGATARHR